MAKTYKKISGTWTAVKKIFKNIGGTWSEIKKAYKKVSGSWYQVHSGALEYTFDTSITATATTGILLSDYVNPALADEFVITVNSGVILKGKDGLSGANGVPSSSNCHGTYTGNGGNGKVGGIGYSGINYTGFSGKKITWINSGTIAGGNGGRGGNGSACTGAICCSVSYGGCGGSGGNGGLSYYANSGVDISYIGNSATSGANGASGSSNSSVCYYSDNCFIAGQKVLMADGTRKNIEDVLCGDKVQGAYGDINTVTLLHRPRLGNRILYKINNHFNTATHPILSADKKTWYMVDINGCLDDKKEYIMFDNEGNRVPWFYNSLDRGITNLIDLKIGDEVATISGTEKITTIEDSGLGYYELQLYNLIADGSHTMCVDGYYVGAFPDDTDFDYTLGQAR